MHFFTLSLYFVILLASSTASLLNISHRQPSSFNLPNLTALETNLGIDPRFTSGVQQAGGDLSDKQTYMNGLKMLARLAAYGFDDPIPDCSWSWPGYTDVTIDIGAPSPGETVETRFVMWGLYNVIEYMAKNNFPSVVSTLWWSGAIVGHINVYQTPSRRLGVEADIQNLSRTMVSPSGTRPSRSNISNVSLVSPTSLNSSRRATDSSLRAFIELDGPRLTKYGVFLTIYGGILTVAEYDQTQHLARRFTISNPRSRKIIEFEPWNFPAESALPFEHSAAIYLISKIPSYMYKQNSFRECTFVVEMDGSPVGRGH